MSRSLLHKRLAQLLIATATTLVIVSGVGIPQTDFTQSPDKPAQTVWKQQTQALAQSGGRSSGGSFGSSRGNSSRGNSSRGNSSRGNSSRGNSSYNSYSYYDNTYDSDGTSLSTGGFYALVIIVLILILFSAISGYEYEDEDEDEYEYFQPTIRSEKDNDIVTVTQIQIAMIAENGEPKQSLSDIATKLDWSTSFGRNTALRATVQLLMTASEHWTHVNGNSTTVRSREYGKHQFENLSRVARSKFEEESLTNIDGNIQVSSASPRKSDGTALIDSIDSEEGASDNYVIVTLIVGTAHDQPLLYGIKSADQLARKLGQLKAIEPDYLLMYELLWSPQNEQEILTAAELKDKYPNLNQVSQTAHANLLASEGTVQNEVTL